MLRYILISFLAVILLGACGAAADEQPATGDQVSPVVTVYRAPT